MKAIQTEFARDVGEKYGLERGVEGSEAYSSVRSSIQREKSFGKWLMNTVKIAQELQTVTDNCKQELQKL